MKIKVEYEGFNKDLDIEICELIKSIGGKWYAQGFDHTSGMRDICFDLEYQPKKLESINP